MLILLFIILHFEDVETDEVEPKKGAIRFYGIMITREFN